MRFPPGHTEESAFLHAAAPHKFRIATTGSTFPARRAGTKQATIATPVNKTDTAKNVIASVELTPYNNPATTRDTA